ncbi:outer membrane beta-barrel family protein [Flavihumibacter sp. UBA7668]|uniref:outer membrane beta-barrel family protein n=1 Tax=Flavihumibacter sp. UBA7668 TaxID=1946542 RepID=UPI0025BD15CD|nr:outer membrane beta-barrel family protein [Flavihumibacter sp. UBA7668]
MRKLLSLIGALFLSAILYAQTTEIRGEIADTSEKKPLANAVVALLSTDSVLLKHTRTDAQGRFSLKATDGKPHLLMVTYPKFADFLDVVNPVGPRFEMGKINLIKKSVLLEEVIVSQKIGAIRMKGDTLEFKADSFAVRQGANVEELLKRFPGFQVNQKGEITAQGERVQKVLVDGEEFFSDDPAVVTQNLQADAIDKVQLFDKKSEQATFTGIDDGEKQKTINLTLKEDRKKGYFGKAKLSGGTPHYFENEAMINAFKGKRKIAAYGTMANTGKAGLSWQDNDRFGGGSNMEYNEDEGYFYSFAESDEFNTWGGRFNGEGLPKAWTAGAHYSNKLNADKTHVNGNYQFYKQNIENEGTNTSQSILADRLFYNNSTRKTSTMNLKHQVSGFYDVKLDSLSSLKVNVSGVVGQARNASVFTAESLGDLEQLINNQDRRLSSIGDRQQMKTSAIWRKKFMKVGRTLSVNFDQQYQNNKTTGNLYSVNRFFDENGELVNSDTVDQVKNNYTQSNIWGARISYTEPISKKWFVETNYGYRINNSKALRSSFVKDFNGKYEVLDSLFSSDYAFDFNTHSTGLNFRFNGSKITASFGSNINFANFLQKDLVRDTVYDYNFTNFFPKANIRFKMGAQRGLNLRYNGQTSQPTLQQIQPILENTDPLNIQVGNPNLKQEFRHNIGLNYNDYKVLTGRSLYFNGGINFIDNAISRADNVDDQGRRQFSFVNVDGNYNYYLYTGYWKELKKIKANFNFSLNFNGGKNNNFVNQVKNTNKYSTLGGQVGFFKQKEKKYEVDMSFGPNYTRNVSSLRPDVVTKYWTTDTRLGATVFFLKDFEFNSNINYQWRQKTDVFGQDRNVILWNAHVAKKFLKKKTAEIRLSINDILNQNIGFQRSASSNFISENTYSTLRRYWLLGVIWNFSRNPGQK